MEQQGQVPNPKSRRKRKGKKQPVSGAAAAPTLNTESWRMITQSRLELKQDDPQIKSNEAKASLSSPPMASIMPPTNIVPTLVPSAEFTHVLQGTQNPLTPRGPSVHRKRNAGRRERKKQVDVSVDQQPSSDTVSEAREIALRPKQDRAIDRKLRRLSIHNETPKLSGSNAIPLGAPRAPKKDQIPTVSKTRFVQTIPVPAPKPLPKYLLQSSQPLHHLPSPQPLLLVLDLNGTLLYRPSRKRSAKFDSRPGLKAFVDFIMSTYAVMVWSSSQPENVSLMCAKIFSPAQRSQLLAEWGRDRLGLSKDQYNSKVQVYKHLDKIWESPTTRTTKSELLGDITWNQTNTVLIDDSLYKASAQPHNILLVPEFSGSASDGHKTKVLAQVAAYLERARHYRDVSSFIFRNPFSLAAEWNGRDILADFA